MNTGSATMQRSACQRTRDFVAGIPHIDLDAAAQLGDAHDDLAGVQPVAERRGQLLVSQPLPSGQVSTPSRSGFTSLALPLGSPGA
jgi:hypothetical protein